MRGLRAIYLVACGNFDYYLAICLLAAVGFQAQVVGL
jgi:hypothetical protein